jgi:hypothetical protein
MFSEFWTVVPSENTIRRVVKRLDVRIDDGVPRFRGGMMFFQTLQLAAAGFPDRLDFRTRAALRSTGLSMVSI